MNRENRENIVIAVIILFLISIGAYRYYEAISVKDVVVKGKKPDIIKVQSEQTDKEIGIEFRPLKTININEGSQKELEKLPGIGEALAKRIISYREENRKFLKKEDIKEVKGIGEKKFEAIKELISVK